MKVLSWSCKMPNKSLQPTPEPLRGFVAAEFQRWAA